MSKNKSSVEADKLRKLIKEINNDYR